MIILLLFLNLLLGAQVSESGITFANWVTAEFPELTTLKESLDYGIKITNDPLRIIYLERAVIGYKKDLLLAQYGKNEILISQYNRRLAFYLKALTTALTHQKDADFKARGDSIVMMVEDEPNLNNYTKIRDALDKELKKLDEYGKNFEPVGADIYCSSIPLGKEI